MRIKHVRYSLKTCCCTHFDSSDGQRVPTKPIEVCKCIWQEEQLWFLLLKLCEVAWKKNTSKQTTKKTNTNKHKQISTNKQAQTQTKISLESMIPIYLQLHRDFIWNIGNITLCWTKQHESRDVSPFHLVFHFHHKSSSLILFFCLWAARVRVPGHSPFSQLILHETDNPNSWEKQKKISFNGQTKERRINQTNSKTN